jgi:hypothetical protein
MNCFRKLIDSVSFLFLLFLMASCNKEPAAPQAGIISVSVIDNDPNQTPVADVEITVTPGDIIRETNANGTASFEVDPGDYFVDADVCCMGPGFIHYHEAVTVAAHQTAELELTACLRCQ